MDLDPLTGRTGAARASAIRAPEFLLVALLWAGAGLIVYWMTRGIVLPRRFQDEFLFWALAKSFAHGDGLTWRGTHVGVQAWLYPVLIAPVFRIASGVQSQYDLVKGVNSALVCAVVFPAYGTARLFVERRLALLAAGFAVAVPALNYAGIVGTESLAYPLCTAAFGGMLLALVRPGARSTAVALLLVALAALTRVQFAILIPVFAGALLLAAALRGGEWREYMRERRVLAIALAAVIGLGAVYLLARGRGAVGIYVGVFHGAPLTFGNLWFWAKAFAADLYLLAAIVPTIATFALFGSRDNRRDPLIGALAALALVAAIAFVLQLTWFSAINPYDWRRQHIFYERYMFYLGPIFFIGLVASFGRVSARAAAISTLVGALVVSGMQSDLIAVPFSLDAFGQAYLGFYFDMHEGALAHAGMLLAALTLLLGGFYVLAQLGAAHAELVRWGRALAVVLPLFVLLITQFKAWSYGQIYAESAATQTPRPLAFVAPSTRERVGMLLASDADPTIFYNAEFWNPLVDRVFVSPRAPVDSLRVYSPTCAFRWDRAGRILPAPVRGTGCGMVPGDWLVIGGSFALHLRDETGRTRPRSSQPVTLIEARRPPRIFAMTGGRELKSGLVATALDVTSFLRAPGRLRVVVAAGDRAVRLRPDGAAAVTVPAGGRTVLSLPVGVLEQRTRIAVEPVGAESAAARFTSVELREGGRWRRAD